MMETFFLLGRGSSPFDLDEAVPPTSPEDEQLDEKLAPSESLPDEGLDDTDPVLRHDETASTSPAADEGVYEPTNDLSIEKKPIIFDDET